MKQNIIIITALLVFSTQSASTDPVPAAPGSVEEAIELGKIETYWKEFKRDAKLTAGEIIANQYCLGSSEHTESSNYLDSFGDNFNQYILNHLREAITVNKRYYLAMKDNRRLMYFRQDSVFFLNLLNVDDQGEEHVLVRYFYEEGLNDCIKVLPESCKFQGSQEVSYERKCKVGSSIGTNLIQDFVNISTSSTTEEASVDEIITAFDECYKPACYNIPFECLRHSLDYDRNEILTQLNTIANNINQDPNQTLFAYVEPHTLTLKYSGTLRQVVRVDNSS